MLQRRFVRVIPLLSKNKPLEEFIISEDHFLQEFNYVDDDNGCEFVADTSLQNSSHPKESKFSEFTLKVDGIKTSLHSNEKCNIKVINKYSNFGCITLTFCCFANFQRKSMSTNYFLKMDGQLFSLVVLELNRSPLFRKAIIDRLFYKYCNRENACQVENTKCTTCGCLWKSIVVGVYLIWPHHCIMDKIWDLKIRILVNERCEIENAMSWLSTLGGAYSSLGDEFLYHAKQAEKISLQQYKLALKLQDPLAVTRCKIYFAMSLVQQGYYKEATRIIRKQYKYAITDEGRLDFRLANMCKAVWNKIKHLQNGL